jgi:hypothetical protein
MHVLELIITWKCITRLGISGAKKLDKFPKMFIFSETKWKTHSKNHPNNLLFVLLFPIDAANI